MLSDETVTELKRLIDHWLDEDTRESHLLIDCANCILDSVCK